MHRAAWKGQQLTVTLLCSRGAFVDAQDAWTRTPLHLAAAYGKYYRGMIDFVFLYAIPHCQVGVKIIHPQ